MNKSSKFVA